MRTRLVFVCTALALMLTASASAQTKLTGTMQCGKPDPSYVVPVGDRPDHVMSLSKVKCMWSGAEIGGVQLKDEEDTLVSDMRAAAARDRGYGASTLANGDKVFVRFEGTTVIKDKAPVTGEGTWTFIGGTGKQKGIKGKGTYKGKFNPDGTATFTIEGEYQLGTTSGN